MEQTSAETVKAVAACKLVDHTDRDRVTDMLATADFVKFAKYTPLQDESARYLDTAYDFVNNTHQRLQQELSEQHQREEAEKERQRREEVRAAAGKETAEKAAAERHEAGETGKNGEKPETQE